jgi:RNA polymerase sigma-70 factor (ECF subfamily)
VSAEAGTIDAALTRLAREDSGRVLALLARRFGDVDLADDAIQDALLEAARTWPAGGEPANPAGWLLAVARRKAIDRLRRTASGHRRLVAAAPDIAAAAEPSGGRTDLEMIDDSSTPTGDEHLRLVLLCCHPALDVDTQIALTLRLVGGLSTAEIAAAYLVPEATLAQRVVRAKRKIRDANIPLSIPASLDERIAAVLGVLYLVFNEGYLSRGAGEHLVRVDLTEEATRLTELVAELLPEHAEVEGLLALELYHRARLATRVDAAGELVLLEDQDRTRWDLSAIERANAVLHAAMSRGPGGRYVVQAIIAGYHANARTAADTDWPAIAVAYRHLMRLDPSPVVALNHAVAVAMADGPLAGLALLDQIEGLDGYHLFHAARGELLARAGDASHAATAFDRAAALTTNGAELRHLARRRAAIAPS